MPSLVLQPATVPVDAAFPPASAQALVNFIAAYLQIGGATAIKGVVISVTEPDAADRDKAWIKRDPGNNRAIGVYVYNGGWLPIPTIVPSGDAEPAGAKQGELFYNTTTDCLRIFDGTSWTSNLWHTGATADRPEDPPINYVYFDTDIGRLLRMTSQGWTTVDGSVGEVRMIDAADENSALTSNPGWSVFGAMAGRFPIGQSELVPAQSEGGVTLDEMKLDWSAQGRSASGGAREATASFIAEVTINGTAARADGTKYDALTKIGSDKTVSLKPPYRSLIFIRKDF